MTALRTAVLWLLHAWRMKGVQRTNEGSSARWKSGAGCQLRRPHFFLSCSPFSQSRRIGRFDWHQKLGGGCQVIAGIHRLEGGSILRCPCYPYLCTPYGVLRSTPLRLQSDFRLNRISFSLNRESGTYYAVPVITQLTQQSDWSA